MDNRHVSISIKTVSCLLPLSLSLSLSGGDDLPVLNIEKETLLSYKGNCVYSISVCVMSKKPQLSALCFHPLSGGNTMREAHFQNTHAHTNTNGTIAPPGSIYRSSTIPVTSSYTLFLTVCVCVQKVILNYQF